MAIEIDGLTIINEIGRGGFGVVYRASDKAHGRDVAVKVLTGTLDDSAKRRFNRERRAMGTLSSHPNIGVVHTSGFTDDRRAFIVMEYLEGGSLDQRITDGPVPVDEAVTIIIALCDALVAAHKAGVLHLDVKPANVLFSQYGRPKLVDFGIAAIAGDNDVSTTIRATPAFAAPEIFDGKRATERSDIYSLAATAYTMLDGSPPYSSTDEGSVLEILRQVAIDPVPTVDRNDVSSELRDVIHQAMSKDPNRRPATMSEFADRLRSVVTSVPRDQPRPTLRPERAASAPVTIPNAIEAPLASVSAGGKAQHQRRLGVSLFGLAAVLLLVALVVARTRSGDTTTTAVPVVAGQSVDDATRSLTAAGFTPFFNDHCYQTVVGTSPEAGRTAPPGASVELLFNPCEVPDFVNLQLDDAISIIENVEGVIIEWPEHCDTTIIGQSIAAGTIVEPFTTTVVLDLPAVC